MARWGTHLVRVWALTSFAFGHSPRPRLGPCVTRPERPPWANALTAEGRPPAGWRWMSPSHAAQQPVGRLVRWAGVMGRCDAPVRQRARWLRRPRRWPPAASGGEFPDHATCGVGHPSVLRGESQPHLRRRSRVPPEHASGRPLGLRRRDRSRRVRRESRGAVVGGGLKRRAPLRHAPQCRALWRSRPLRPPRPRRRPR